jgi:aminopeptidase
MDPRIEAHADVLVDYSIEAEPGDEVLLLAGPNSAELTVALNRRLGEVGANVTQLGGHGRAQRAFLRAADPDAFETSEATLAAVEAADAVVAVRASTNAHETADVDPETTAAYRRARQPIQEALTEGRWLITQFPTPADAQAAGMSTEAYEDLVWSATNRDWREQYEFQERFVEILDPADEVRIVSGEATDVRMDVSGMHAVNDHGKNNVPAGEVFTAPNPDSVEGEVVFDVPVVRDGKEIEDARLVFEDGVVVEHSARGDEDALTGILDTDAGARRLGELGVGMNRGIDRFTRNTLFDEKMGDTVHLAIGRPIDECLPAGAELHDSAVHLDMIVDVSEDSRIEVDGEVVQRNGTFVFEDGFEG